MSMQLKPLMWGTCFVECVPSNDVLSDDVPSDDVSSDDVPSDTENSTSSDEVIFDGICISYQNSIMAGPKVDILKNFTIITCKM